MNEKYISDSLNDYRIQRLKCPFLCILTSLLFIGYISPVMELLNRENSGLIVIDAQQKLMSVMGRKKKTIEAF